MRHSRKETALQRMMREGLMPEKRESLATAYQESVEAEFAGEWEPGTRGSGRRLSPGGRG